MTRSEAENKMLNKLREVVKIYREYNPNGDYLSIGIFMKRGGINLNNAFWDEDADAPISIHVNDEV